MERGAGMGAASAALNNNSQDFERAEGFAAAINDGVREARRRDAREVELMNSPEHLEEMGFHGRTFAGTPDGADKARAWAVFAANRKTAAAARIAGHDCAKTAATSTGNGRQDETAARAR
jgi:hypothetical protein